MRRCARLAAQHQGAALLLGSPLLHVPVPRVDDVVGRRALSVLENDLRVLPLDGVVGSEEHEGILILVRIESEEEVRIEVELYQFVRGAEVVEEELRLHIAHAGLDGDEAGTAPGADDLFRHGVSRHEDDALDDGLVQRRLHPETSHVVCVVFLDGSRMDRFNEIHHRLEERVVEIRGDRGSLRIHKVGNEGSWLSVASRCGGVLDIQSVQYASSTGASKL
jgi:hypothetical protein